jgi:ATP-dependent DNA helicase RecG
LISEAFYLTGDIEKYGSGFMRIRQALSSYPTMTMDIKEIGGGFLATISYIKQKTTTITGADKRNVPENVPENVPTNIIENVLEDVIASVPENISENVPENVPENRFLLIIRLIEKNNMLSMQDMANLLNVHEKTIKRDIQKLKQKGLLERIGSDRGGYWKIKKQ